jgi:hypothetical protein
VPLPVPVQAEENQVGFRQVDRERAVRHDVHEQEPRLFRFDDQIPQGPLAVFPEERFAPAQEQNPDPHIVQPPHLLPNLRVRMNDRGNIIDGAMLAAQIAFVGNDDRPKNGRVLPKQDRLRAKTG